MPFLKKFRLFMIFLCLIFLTIITAGLVWIVIIAYFKGKHDEKFKALKNKKDYNYLSKSKIIDDC